MCILENHIILVKGYSNFHFDSPTFYKINHKVVTKKLEHEQKVKSQYLLQRYTF